MSGIGDQGMMPEHVRPRKQDDDTVDESVADPGAPVDGEPETARQTEVEDGATISDDEFSNSDDEATNSDDEATISDDEVRPAGSGSDHPRRPSSERGPRPAP